MKTIISAKTDSSQWLPLLYRNQIIEISNCKGSEETGFQYYCKFETFLGEEWKWVDEEHITIL